MLAVSPHPAVAGSDAVTHGEPPLRAKHATKPRLDFSGRKRLGIASFYANWLAGRKIFLLHTS